MNGNDGNRSWTQREYPHALEAMDTGRIGFNFTPGTLGEDAAALDWVLDLPPEHRLCAVMLSFGDARPIPRALQPSVLH